jgi:uncharacterized membrane protein
MHKELFFNVPIHFTQETRKIKKLIPISLIKFSTLYVEKIANNKAFILVTSCSNYKINNAVIGDFNK